MSNELSEIAKGIFKTFVNRRDTFAFQLDDGRYFASHREITVEHVIGHLRGNITIGV